MRGRLPLAAVSLAAGLSLWQLTALTGWVDPQKLPSPLTVASDVWSIAVHGYGEASLWTSLLVSAGRLFAGMGVAIVLGVGIGYASSESAVARGLVEPVLAMVRSIPPLGLLSLLVVWFGIGEVSKVVMLTIAATAPIVLATAHGIRSVRLERLQGARSLGYGGLRLFGAVVLPSALPDILTGVRLGFGYAFGGLVAAEMIGASRGLGWMVWNASQYGETGVVIVLIAVIGLAGFTIDAALGAVRDRLTPWAGRA